MSMAQSHGTGQFALSDLASLGQECVFEPSCLVFHPENIHIGDNVYVGHYAILKAYYKNTLHIGSNTWVGQHCFFHSAGGISIGQGVGIGPGVKILTSHHETPQDPTMGVMESPLAFAPVVLEDGSDIGTGAIILPGVTVGNNAIVGAGAVVTKDVPKGAICYGAPAKVQRYRPGYPVLTA